MPRTINLYRRARDNGRPVVWRHAAQVLPVSAFERNGRWIKSGHYVIDYRGDAVVVHCCSMGDDNVSVHFVSEEFIPYSLPRKTIESMLLGKVMVSEE